MKTPKIMAQCPHCGDHMPAKTLRRHYCEKIGGMSTKQEWWQAVDKALVAAGEPEMVYAYEVEYRKKDGTIHKFRCAVSSEVAAKRKAIYKSLFKCVLQASPFTYAQYCRVFGPPGSRM